MLAIECSSRHLANERREKSTLEGIIVFQASKTLPALGLANTDTERCRKTLAVHTWSFLLVLYNFIKIRKTSLRLS